MFDLLKNPKKQIGVIVILISCYWGYHISFDPSDIPIQVTVQSSNEGTPVDTLNFESQEEFEQLQRQLQVPPTKSVDEFEDIPDDELLTDYEQKIRFWDMILSHLSSILGSLAALLSPLITVYLNKKGYLSKEEAAEDI